MDWIAYVLDNVWIRQCMDEIEYGMYNNWI